jgi:hypothetical protein
VVKVKQSDSYTAASEYLSMTLATDFSCPNCGHAIKLTESLAAPLVAATRAEYENRLAAQGEAVAAEKLVLSHSSKPTNVELRSSPPSPKISMSRSLVPSSSRFETRSSSSFPVIAKLSLTRSLRVPASRLTMSYKRRRRTSSSKPPH